MSSGTLSRNQKAPPVTVPNDEPAMDDDLDFEIVTSSRMLAPPPALRKEAVTITDWLTVNDKPARFLVWELTAADYADFLETGRIYKDSAFQRYDQKYEDI